MVWATDDRIKELSRDGFVLIANVFEKAQVREILGALEQAFERQKMNQAIRSDSGHIYAARNILDLWPQVTAVWRRPPLPDFLEAILGPNFGLVRVLYFDKPPDQTWALPWHKDLTIAVRAHLDSGSQFTKPTVKAGVPHVEAPVEILQSMLTARIHLDEVTRENGPVQVICGSHHDGKTMRLGNNSPCTLVAPCGSVLLIRPLVTHSSIRSHDTTRSHRRILHLEFAASPCLPEGYNWHDFYPGMPGEGDA